MITYFMYIYFLNKFPVLIYLQKKLQLNLKTLIKNKFFWHLKKKYKNNIILM